MARITVNGDVCQFSTKQKINPKNWCVEAKRAIGKSVYAQNINNLLEEVKGTLFKIYQEIQLKDNYVTAEKVRNTFMGNTQNCATLLELFKKHNDDVSQLIGISKSKATYQKYQVTKRHISEFMRIKYNISDIYVKEISPMFIKDFEIYLMTIGNCSANTTAKFLQFFKRIIIIAKDNGMLQADPFINFKIRIAKVDRGYLTEEQIAIIAQKQFASERLDHVRDLFIFSCFSGLAYIDLKNLTADNIKKSFDGKQWIMTKRQKTNTTVNVPLLAIPQMILDKYKGKLPDGALLPMISNQKLNSYLKEIADVCGIELNLTFHLARHTFATTTTLAKGIPIETVSKMLGHTNISTTQIYARITNDKISKDMDGLSSKFSKIENLLTEDVPMGRKRKKVVNE